MEQQPKRNKFQTCLTLLGITLNGKGIDMDTIKSIIMTIKTYDEARELLNWVTIQEELKTNQLIKKYLEAVKE